MAPGRNHLLRLQLVAAVDMRRIAKPEAMMMADEAEEYRRGFRDGYEYGVKMGRIFPTPIPAQTPEQLASAERLKQEALDRGFFPGVRQ